MIVLNHYVRAEQERLTMTEHLPFNTCQTWERQQIAVKRFPLYEIYRSFSWQNPDSDGWNFSTSLVLICPRCLEKWAHLVFDTPKNMRELPGCMNPVGAFCGECGQGEEGSRTPPGSILIGYHSIDLPLLYALPEELVKREFFLHLRQLEKSDDLFEN